MGCWSSDGLGLGLLLAEHPILASSDVEDPPTCKHIPYECLLMVVLTFVTFSLASSLGFSIVALKDLETSNFCYSNFSLDHLLYSRQ